MHKSFAALSTEKQNRILNAAMAEFKRKGFRKASTNEIVRQAGISKGSLFHYFSTKQALFEYLYRHNLQLFSEQLLPRLDNLPSDVLERWSAVAMLKMKLVTQYPLIFDFMLAATMEEDGEVQAFLAGVQTGFTKDFHARIHEGIDLDKFREGLNLPQALEIIWWTLEGFAKKLQETARLEDLRSPAYVQSCLCEMKQYLHLLKQSFYKEEFQI